jgi:hypothetical protein
MPPELPVTLIRRRECGEVFRVRRFINFIINGQEHTVVVGYLVSFRDMLSIYLGTDKNVTAFLITRPYSREVLPDETVIGLYNNISIAHEYLEVIPLPVELYNEEIQKRMTNKLRFGEYEVFRFGPPPTADEIGNKFYRKGTYEIVS